MAHTSNSEEKTGCFLQDNEDIILLLFRNDTNRYSLEGSLGSTNNEYMKLLK